MKENGDSSYTNVFNDIIKYIEANFDLNNHTKNVDVKILKEKTNLKLDEISKKGIDLSLIRDNLNNTLIQYYITKENITNNSNIIIIIKEYYYKKISDLNGDKYYQWLLNDNASNLNIFEQLILNQWPLNKQIDLFNNLFNYIGLRETPFLSQLLNNRNNNIFNLCTKENNIPLLLYLLEKIKPFFPSQNIIDIKNNEGQTPLHISCLYSNKNAADNLVLLGCNINEKDSQGNTPLHFAAGGGNLKLAKKLVLFGADASIKNNENLTPIDISKTADNFNMRGLFNKGYFNRITSIKKKNREYLLLIMVIICATSKIFFYLKKNKDNIRLNMINICYFFSFIFDLICSGFIIYPKIFGKKFYAKKNKNLKNYNLMNNIVKYEDLYKLNNYDLDKLDQLCPVCKIIRPPKTKHCILCNKCIDNWDHHCYWLNICINKKNFNFFLFFLITLFLVIMLNIIIFSSICFSMKKMNKLSEKMNTLMFGLIIGILVVLFWGLFSVVRYFNQIKKNRKIDKQRILSLEDVLSNSSSTSLSVSLNKSIASTYSNYHDIKVEGGSESSIEFQEIIN